MSAKYFCDKCGKEFGGSLDRVNGFDLCAPCRKELTDKHQQTEDAFFKEIKI